MSKLEKSIAGYLESLEVALQQRNFNKVGPLNDEIKKGLAVLKKENYKKAEMYSARYEKIKAAQYNCFE